jgi:Tfp pilus assembly protein PilN
MLSLLNKSGGKSDAGQALAWHPNFRNAEQLPDTKTVRTKFFVNVVAITLLAALVLVVTLRELKLASLRSELADVEAQIAAATKPSEKAIADYKLYQEQEKRFNDAYALVKDPFRVPEFLMHLGSILPHGVRIKRVDFRGQVVNVSGSVRGLDAAASDVASEFVKTLQSDKDFAVHFSAITLRDLGRNVDDGNMNFELVFAFKALPKETKPKAKEKK